MNDDHPSQNGKKINFEWIDELDSQPKQLRRMADAFRLLASETAAYIVEGLRKRPEGLTVTELMQVAKASQSATSHRLRLLKGADIVESAPVEGGHYVRYRLTDTFRAALMQMPRDTASLPELIRCMGDFITARDLSRKSIRTV